MALYPINLDSANMLLFTKLTTFCTSDSTIKARTCASPAICMPHSMASVLAALNYTYHCLRK